MECTRDSAPGACTVAVATQNTAHTVSVATQTTAEVMMEADLRVTNHEEWKQAVEVNKLDPLTRAGSRQPQVTIR